MKQNRYSNTRKRAPALMHLYPATAGAMASSRHVLGASWVTVEASQDGCWLCKQGQCRQVSNGSMVVHEQAADGAAEVAW